MSSAYCSVHALLGFYCYFRDQFHITLIVNSLCGLSPVTLHDLVFLSPQCPAVCMCKNLLLCSPLHSGILLPASLSALLSVHLAPASSLCVQDTCLRTELLYPSLLPVLHIQSLPSLDSVCARACKSLCLISSSSIVCFPA